MKKQMLGLSCAILLAGWAGDAYGDPNNTPNIIVISNTNGSTNALSSTSNGPVAWPISPRDPASAGATLPNTNSVVLLEAGNTNAPVAAPPAAAPPVPVPTGEESPDSIQSAPTLQGSAPDKGPI